MLKGILRLAGRHRRRLALGTALRILEALLSTVPLLMLYLFVTGIVGDGGPGPDAWILAAAILGAAVLQVGLLQASTRLCYEAGLATLEDLRHALADHLRRLPLGYFAERSVGEMSESLVQDLRSIEPAITHVLPQTIASVALAATVLGAMLCVSPTIGLLCLAGVPLAAPLLAWSQARLKRLMPRRLTAQAEASSRVLEFMLGLPVLKSLRLTESQFRLVRTALARNRRENIGLVSSVVPTGIGYVLAVELGFPAIALIGGLAVAADSMTLPALLFGLVAALKLYPPVQHVIAYSAHLRIAEAAIGRVRAVLDAPVMAEPTHPRHPAGFDVSFHDVAFGYGDAPTLHGIDCVLPERRLTAVTGPSGAGKTTLAHLAARYWDVRSGSVRIGGTDVRALDPDALTRLVAIVFQEVFLFDDTILDNIRIGRPDATDDDVVAAARAARCHDFIMQLPKGYGTEAGEAGARLSGGERQRLSIARAILKDAPIVILDEPTASVDPENEREIQKAIASLVAARTVLIVAHRLSTIVHADQILVMDQGRIVGRGRHETLLAECPLYRSLWELQAPAAAPPDLGGALRRPATGATPPTRRADAAGA